MSCNSLKILDRSRGDFYYLKVDIKYFTLSK